eukprot:3466390-Prymnesium_polylepis.1
MLRAPTPTRLDTVASGPGRDALAGRGRRLALFARPRQPAGAPRVALAPGRLRGAHAHDEPGGARGPELGRGCSVQDRA